MSPAHPARTSSPVPHRRTLRVPNMARSLTIPALLFCTTVLPSQDILAIKGGTVRLDPLTILEKATILIKDGRIEKIGKDLEIPWNAKVLDASGKYVMPAWILAQGSGGLDRENENMPVTPYLSVLDSLDPVSLYFETARRAGFGVLHITPGNNCAIGGQGMVLKPYGKTPEQMALLERAGMKISLQAGSGGRTKHLATILKAFEGALLAKQDFDRRKKEFEEEKKNGATTKTEWEEVFDPLQQPLLDLLDGKITGFVYIPSAADVPAAIKLCRKYRFPAVFILGNDCYKAADLLAPFVRKRKIPLILDWQIERIETDPVTGKKKIVCPPKVFADKGLEFCLTTASVSGRFRSSPSLAYVLPQWQIGAAVRGGVPFEEALAAFTTRPASVLGLGDRVGKIAPGFDAYIQVLSAAPLEPESVVEYLILEGKQVYDRSKDPRVKYLTGRKTTANDEGNH